MKKCLNILNQLKNILIISKKKLKLLALLFLNEFLYLIIFRIIFYLDTLIHKERGEDIKISNIFTKNYITDLEYEYNEE